MGRTWTPFAAILSHFRRAVWSWHARVAAAAAAALLLFLLLNGFYRRELHHFTGDARWMWTTDDLHDPVPTAGLFFRRLKLARLPLSAVAKVCGDRQYVLWINGQPAVAGHNRPEFRLDVVDVTDLLVAGDNLIAIEARSPTSVGGVLFALDLRASAEGRRAGDPNGRSCLVSGPRWRVLTTWGEGPSVYPKDGWSEPWIWGQPPDHPWTYPRPVVHPSPVVHSVFSDPIRIPSGCFEAVGEGLWACTLERRLQGYLWIDLTAGPTPQRIGLGDGTATVGAGIQDVPVVTLDGQTMWLYPGAVEGAVLEASGEAAPAGVELVEGQP